MKWYITLFLVFYSVANNVQCKISVVELVSTNKEVIWTLENKNGSIKIPATVPGGVYSDLRKAGVIGDILSGFNDVYTRWVSYDTWTYIGRFNVNMDMLSSTIARIVFHGVDTVAFMELNGSPIGCTDNMFVRYVFDVKRLLKEGDNELKITFVSPVEAARLRSEKYFTAPECVPEVYNGECHANQLRKMQASFSWDWGPAFPSVGLWKSAAIEFYNGAIIRGITTHIETKDHQWHLKIKAYIESIPKLAPIKGYMSASLSVEGHETIEVANDVEITTANDGSSETELNLVISENKVLPWWPNGYGDQNLYDLNVFLTTQGNSDETSHKYVQIGFRTLEVVEEEASLRLGNTTEGEGLTFYFKINGYPLFMKGSNWIPANILPELGYNKSIVDSLLTAAKDTHMGMLRVWGGGLYESDYFYQKCNQLGILIWQDLLFACSMYPADPEFLDTVQTEIEQNVKRLQHHPSIALWAGNNENEVALRGNWYNTAAQYNKYKDEYIKLYVHTIKPIVETLDPGRRYLVSSPSNGLQSEKDGYIADNPYDSHYGDTHYYNYIADNWNSNIYPPTRFASEYGFQSLPSMKTISNATNKKDDLIWNSKFLQHRQHSPNGFEFIKNQLNRHLLLDENDPKYLEKFVFYSQISQAMAMKTETEFYRQSQADWYTMGALYWQLNDVWQAPSWSGIEYGGKWKMLHYFAKSFFAPVLVSPRLLLSGDVDVYLINDRFVPISSAQITVDVYNWSSVIPIKTTNYPAYAEPLSSKKQDISISWIGNNDETFMRFSLKAAGVKSTPYNYVFPQPLKSVKGLEKPNITIKVSRHTRDSSKGTEYTVDIQSQTVVMFLWLETSIDGYFEENGFILTQPTLRVKFISAEKVSYKIVERSITYQSYFNEAKTVH